MKIIPVLSVIVLNLVVWALMVVIIMNSNQTDKVS